MIKEIRDIETNELQGYEFNKMFVPLEPSNRHYQEIQELIKKGEKVIPAFTEEEKLDYFKNKRIQELKQIRNKKVKTIVITLSTGETLNGDELAQTRMTRALSVLPNNTTTIEWIDVNNELVQLDKSKFKEALKLAGQEQTNIFVKYNKLRDIIKNITDIETLKNGIINFNNASFEKPKVSTQKEN